MLIFLYGPDSFRSKEKLQEIISHYKKVQKSALNLISLDADKITFSDFYNNFKISSMFVETKLVIIKNIFSQKDFQEAFLDEIKTLAVMKDVVVVYEDEQPDQRRT